MPNDQPIPEEKRYVIKQATYSLSIDIRNEADTVEHHAQRVELANMVLGQTGNLSALMAEIAEASVWGTTINWETVTNNAIKNTISGVWNHIALAKFGEDAE